MLGHVSQHLGVMAPTRGVGQTIGGLILTWSHACLRALFWNPGKAHAESLVHKFYLSVRLGNVSLLLRCLSSGTLTPGLPTLTRQIRTREITLSISKVVWSEGLIIFEQLSWTLLRSQFPFQLAFLRVQGRVWQQGLGTSQCPPYGSIFSNVHKFPRV